MSCVGDYLDQFPLNMFRGSAQSFASEAQSRDVAAIAIEQGFDKALPAEQRSFLYMPYMHSETLKDQELALQLFDQPDSNQTCVLRIIITQSSKSMGAFRIVTPH